jgi:hypothetical protein
MTEEQINERITEITGLWDHPYSSDTRRMMDFCNDLNAMHEAEKALMQNNNKYPTTLSLVLYLHSPHKVWPGTCTFAYICATARQRAEAFLRTLGKWEEGE